MLITEAEADGIISYGPDGLEVGGFIGRGLDNPQATRAGL